jgi:hypothetical protein
MDLGDPAHNQRSSVAAIGPAVTAARRNLPASPDPATGEPAEAAGSASAVAHAAPAPRPGTT